jgi:cell division protein FtsQ
VDQGATTAPIPVIGQEPVAREAIAQESVDPGDEATASPEARRGGIISRRGRPPSARAQLRDARRKRKRFERGEVRRFTKRSRQRRLAWLSGLAVLGALVLGVALTAFSPLMALHTIQVQGTQRISASALQTALAGQLGRPLPLVDFGAIKRDLAAFPLIRSYTTESHPPGTLIVRIVERKPVAVTQVGSKFLLVDPAGVTISSSAQRPAGYPIVKPAGAAGSAAWRSGFTAAVAVLQVLPADLLSKVDVVTAATTDDVTFTLAGGGPTVVWGSPDQSDLKAVDLARIMAAPGLGRITVYDVSSPHTVVTR